MKWKVLFFSILQFWNHFIISFNAVFTSAQTIKKYCLNALICGHRTGADLKVCAIRNIDMKISTIQGSNKDMYCRSSVHVKGDRGYGKERTGNKSLGLDGAMKS